MKSQRDSATKIEVKSPYTGRSVVVETSSDAAARAFAMRQWWGPPTGMYAPEYHGHGLITTVQHG